MATTDSKFQTQPIIKPKRRKCREATVCSSASSITEPLTHIPTRKLDPPTIESKPLLISSPPPPRRDVRTPVEELDSPSLFRFRFSPGSLSPFMDFTYTATPPPTNHGQSSHSAFPSSFSKFNSALTAGLLNPMSPPPDKTRSSPTLIEMMASEPDIHSKTQIPIVAQNFKITQQQQQLQSFDTHQLKMQRITDLLLTRSPGNQFNESTSSDMKLTLSSKDGISVSLYVHRQILVAHSRFFAVKLSDQQQKTTLPHLVEIADCDDVEVYIKTLRLMYCKDLKKNLMKEDVLKVLDILKVSAAIGFDAGVLTCLEYLEAAPWAENEEEKVASLLCELQLEGVGASEVLKRVSVEVANGTEEGSDNEEVLLKLLHVVLEGKDEKARREMKRLVSKMLHENSSQNDIRKESLYSACGGCLQLLRKYLLQAASGEMLEVGQIARQADNLHWVLDILIDRQIAEDFLKTWASQFEISEAHSKVPAVHRFEVSGVTARLFVGIGKGQLLATKDVRYLLLRTWLEPFYDDFGWMRRASKGLDRHVIEDGLSNTILTLPLAWQQEILLGWFNRFLNSSEDCPNIQRGFEVWWRRAFWRRNGEQERPQQLRITAATIENS